MTPAAKAQTARTAGPAAAARDAAAAGAPGRAGALDWGRRLDDSPRSALQRRRLAAAFGWPAPPVQEQTIAEPAPAAPGSQRAGPDGAAAGGVTQRSVGERVLKAQIMGMNKTVNPFFGWKGYYKGMRDIVRGPDAAEKYGSVPWRVLNALVVTADRVASLATALAFVLTGIGTIMTAFYGTGAAVLAVATIMGIIATIAHAVTFLLRGVVTIYDGVRLKQVGNDAHRRAILTAKMWNNAAGLVANGLGVLFGGLTGGFIVAGPLSTALGGAIGGSGTAAGDAAASGASVLVGEGANRVADMASVTGAIKANGIEKRGQRAQAAPSNPLPTQDEPEPQAQERSVSESLVEITRDTEEVSDQERDNTRQQDQTAMGIVSADPPMADLLGNSGKLEDQSQVAAQQLDGAKEQVGSAEPTAKNAEKVETLETQMLAVEQQQGGAVETVETVSPAKDKEEPVLTLKSRAVAAASPYRPVQRGVGKTIKRAFGALGARLAGLRKRIKGAMAKVKLKLMQLTVQALGLRKPLLEVQSQQPQDKADLQSASATTSQTAASAADLRQQVEQARAKVDEAQP